MHTRVLRHGLGAWPVGLAEPTETRNSNPRSLRRSWSSLRQGHGAVGAGALDRLCVHRHVQLLLRQRLPPPRGQAGAQCAVRPVRGPERQGLFARRGAPQGALHVELRPGRARPHGHVEAAQEKVGGLAEKHHDRLASRAHTKEPLSASTDIYLVFMANIENGRPLIIFSLL